MICYKDRTFCTAKECTDLECRLNTKRPDFQPGDMLVAYADFKKTCPDYKTEVKENESSK